MFDKNDFIQKIDKSFWNHIHKESYIPIEKPKDKQSFLENLYEDISAGRYFPSGVREYIVSNKHNKVARIVPTFHACDYCVYYFCIKSLERYLAINRVETTFGGYRLGNEFLKKEKDESKVELSVEVEPDYCPSYAFNRHMWQKVYKDFNKKLATYCEEYSSFIEFDIANFYDNVNLSILESKVRGVVSKKLQPHVQLLFFFLRNWDRRLGSYAERTVGLPQDEVADCSRILANFYLQDYDLEMKKICDLHQMRYFRYSDDQLLMGQSPDRLDIGLFSASKELAKIGLNINSSKVKSFSKEGLKVYRSFYIFDKLNEANNQNAGNEAAQLYFEYIDNKLFFKYESPLKYLLKIINTLTDKNLKRRLMQKILDDSFLSTSSEDYLSAIIKTLSADQKPLFLSKLMRLAETVLFNSFHYNLLNFKQKNFAQLKADNLDIIIDTKRLGELIESRKLFTKR